MSNQLNRLEVEEIFESLKRKVLSAIESNKEVEVSFENGFRDTAPDTNNSRQFKPSNEFWFNLHIPADL